MRIYSTTRHIMSNQPTYGWEAEKNPHNERELYMDEAKEYQGCPCNSKGYPVGLGCSACVKDRLGGKEKMVHKTTSVLSSKCNWANLAKLGIYP